MATARSTSRARAGADRSEPETVAGRRPTNTRSERSADSSRSTSSSSPRRALTERARLSAPTASAESAPARRAAATTSCSRLSSMSGQVPLAVQGRGGYGEALGPRQAAPAAGARLQP